MISEIISQKRRKDRSKWYFFLAFAMVDSSENGYLRLPEIHGPVPRASIPEAASHADIDAKVKAFRLDKGFIKRSPCVINKDSE